MRLWSRLGRAAAAAWFAFWDDAEDSRAAQTRSVADPLAPQDRHGCSRHASDPQFAKFCAWLEDACEAEGLDKVFFAGFEHGGAIVRGIGATRDFNKSEEIICVPKKCWLTAGGESERVKGLTSRCAAEERLGIHIAEEVNKSGGSFWAPLLALFPDEAVYKQFHPAFMEGNTSVHANHDYWPHWTSGLQRCYARYRAAAKETAVPPAGAYLAYVQLLTRRFGGVDIPPLLDYCNTGPKEQLNVQIQYGGSRSDDEESVCLAATRKLRKDEEILVDYGAADHSAALMFAIYGFALGPEDHDPSKHDWPGAEQVDGCAGMRAHEFREPDAEKQPVLHNYWRFAQLHCRDEADAGAAPQSSEAWSDLRILGGGLTAAGLLIAALSLASLRASSAREKMD